MIDDAWIYTNINFLRDKNKLGLAFLVVKLILQSAKVFEDSRNFKLLIQ